MKYQIYEATYNPGIVSRVKETNSLREARRIAKAYKNRYGKASIYRGDQYIGEA